MFIWLFPLANIAYELGKFSFDFYSFTQQCLNVGISFWLTEANHICSQEKLNWHTNKNNNAIPLHANETSQNNLRLTIV